MTEHASPKKLKLANIKKNVVKFFKDIRMELKKVIWPNRKQLVNNTGTVLMACLVVGAIIWIIDLGLTKIIEITLAR